ncbi:putative Glycoside-Pentoside-Hexuronide(GPH):CationSymporterFamilyProtein [Monocercomonoides exilis]|uniref:putative Glycoside-Pentoside- Hexuronide(GPH):CationSymporterFamilyProtein n=1 Tax=Monocercomonoides exilis TaxID=2049356 RepID=UPI00355ABD43|nr:putative Glycoside-Pentoside-Hexuronide(GPH):CationSymporterFamilyProtein [Monocercomonoides exilis]|eukprot:MONOS_10162.1-p1 / transcript=MONOS_10162.1 / gene=MONOS_10162 / organism=Monocercomonoides_exilis_PA203 / gene_product=Glycoside-Pentoside-Hexuronide(GPH):CationSymporterFamilyProtein / transcript_product=Glycoside-Pentoside-Hexuronide(GPH):CationSymporterFamilyProtein / location=Mono_scaffold00450:29367-31115(-) / protein_length=545 / sequence_SO=supercontig / SO=protein_coding / is_pseudo=false
MSKDNKTAANSEKSKPKVHICRLLAASAHRVASPLASTISMTAFSPLLIQYGTPTWAVPLVRLLAPLVGLLHPVIGRFSDSCTSRFGRRKPYMFVGLNLLLLSVSCFYMISRKVYKKPLSNIIVLVFSYFLQLMGENFIGVPGRTLVFDIAGKERRSTGNFVMLLLTSLGAFVGLVIIAINYHAFLIIDILIITSFVITFVFTPDPKQEKVEKAKQKKTSILLGFKFLVKNRQLFIIILVTLFSCLAFLYYGSSSTLFITSALYHSDDPNIAPEIREQAYARGVTAGSLMGIVLILSMLVFSMLIMPLINCFGLKAVVFTIETLATACLFSLAFIKRLHPNTLWLVFLTNLVFGSLSAMLMMVPSLMIAEAVKPEELGMYMGIFSLVDTVGQAISSLLPVPINASMGLTFAGMHYLQWNYLENAILGCVCCIISLFIQRKKKGGVNDGITYFTKMSPEKRDEMISAQFSLLTTISSGSMATSMTGSTEMFDKKAESSDVQMEICAATENSLYSSSSSSSPSSYSSDAVKENADLDLPLIQHESL